MTLLSFKRRRKARKIWQTSSSSTTKIGSNHTSLLFGAVCLLLVQTAQAAICSCSPLTFRWELDFSASCPPPDLDIGPKFGVRKVFCDTDSESDDITPVVISSYQLIELSRTLQPINKKEVDNVALTEGDVIEFTSITATQPGEISGGFQAEIIGLNSNMEEISLSWIVQYTNLCEEMVFEEGDGIGWLIFSSTSTPPRAKTCQFPSLRPSGTPTSNPTKMPTRSPIISPSTTPSLVPTEAPTIMIRTPTMSPSQSPTIATSNRPTIDPTPSPTPYPTSSPVAIPSTAPTPIPTENPTSSPTSSPNEAPSAIPSTMPAMIPAISPTRKPSAGPSTISPTDISSGKPSISPSTSPSGSEEPCKSKKKKTKKSKKNKSKMVKDKGKGKGKKGKTKKSKSKSKGKGNLSKGKGKGKC